MMLTGTVYKTASAMVVEKVIRLAQQMAVKMASRVVVKMDAFAASRTVMMKAQSKDCKQAERKAVTMDTLMVLLAVDSTENNLAVKRVAIWAAATVVWKVAVKAFFSVEMRDTLMESFSAVQLVSESVAYTDTRRVDRKALRP